MKVDSCCRPTRLPTARFYYNLNSKVDWILTSQLDPQHVHLKILTVWKGTKEATEVKFVD